MSQIHLGTQPERSIIKPTSQNCSFHKTSCRRLLRSSFFNYVQRISKILRVGPFLGGDHYMADPRVRGLIRIRHIVYLVACIVGKIVSMENKPKVIQLNAWLFRRFYYGLTVFVFVYLFSDYSNDT